MTAFRIATALAALLTAACQTQPLDWQGSPGDTDLRRYKDSYYRALGDRFVGTVDKAQFLNELRGARVLYLGDHHRDPMLHDRILGLLREVALAGLQPVLGLEAVGEQDTGLVSLYLGGRWSMAQLRVSMLRRWAGSWLETGEVDFVFYRDLLELAREYYWPVFGLEPTPRLPLERRDAAMAANIRRAAEEHPGRLIVVVVGQAHLLGDGELVHRVSLPHVAVGANLSFDLMKRVPGTTRNEHFLRSSSGVLFFNSSRPE